jgi:O-antigen ligase
VNKPVAIADWTATYWKIAIMTLALAWLLRKPEYFTLFARGMVLAGCLVASVAISNKLQGIGLVEGTRVTIGRDIGSVLGDPNDLSLVLLFPLGSAVSLVAFRNGFLNGVLGLVGTVLIVWAIICTQSRGGLLGILAVFGIFGFRIVRSKLLLIGVGGAAALVLFLAAGISGRQSGGAAEEGIDESAMGRIYAWQAAWNMATARPLTGVGLDNFVPNYYAYSPHWDGHNHAVHSTWFNVLSETGFPGFALFIAMSVRAAISAYGSMAYFGRQRDGPPIMRAMSVAVFAGLIGFFVAGTFLTQGFTWPIYVLLALATAMHRLRVERGGLAS